VEGEHNKAIQTARRLISMGIDPEKIAEATGLSVEDVNSIAPSG